MKFHTPFFIIGFVLVALPLLGMPQIYQDISTITFGLGLMILSASANFNKIRNKIDMMNDDMDSDNSSELESEEPISPTYAEMTEMIAELEEDVAEDVEDKTAEESELKSE